MKKLTSLLLTACFCLQAQAGETLRIADFEDARELDWQIINDTVMGGKSSSTFTVDGGQLVFSGYLNTNGGGFASLRSAPKVWDLSQQHRVRLRIRGDGRTYQVRLHPSGSRIAYKTTFPTTAEEWQTVEFALEDFRATWRGRELNEPPPEAAALNSIGLLLADGQDGHFTLTVDWIEFAAGKAVPSR
jgi:NADH dehydrogenase [ubiquinone] 1 alpha subcomplex assembly factor 1